MSLSMERLEEFLERSDALVEKLTSENKALKAALARDETSSSRAAQEPAGQSCFCHSGVSLQSVSGGASPDGYLGRLTLLIDGLRVEYVAAQPAQESAELKMQDRVVL
jgi:hypothetical protein